MARQKLKKIPGRDLEPLIVSNNKPKKIKPKTKTKNKPKYKVKYKNILLVLAIILIIFILGSLFFNIKIKNIYIKGNNILKDQEIIDLAGIRSYPKTFNHSTKTIEKKLEKNIYIKDAKVKKSDFFKTVTIEIVENRPILYNLSTNKTVLSSLDEVDKIYKVPVLTNYLDNQILKDLVQELDKLDNDVLMRISEIKYVPTDVDKELFLLTMNDQNYVYININTIYKIDDYLNILLTFNNKKGILHLDSGDYFEIIEEESSE